MREAIRYAAEAERDRNFALDGNFERLDPIYLISWRSQGTN